MISCIPSIFLQIAVISSANEKLLRSTSCPTPVILTGKMFVLLFMARNNGSIDRMNSAHDSGKFEKVSSEICRLEKIYFGKKSRSPFKSYFTSSVKMKTSKES